MTEGALTSITVSNCDEISGALNGTYKAPPAPLMSAPLMSMPIVTAVLPEKTQEAETAPELSEIAETVEAEGTETIEVVEQIEEPVKAEETVESATTSELAWILATVDLDAVHWLGDEDGRECYISDSCLVFTYSSEQDEIALDTLLTQNGSGWMLENGSVTVTFVMEDGMLSQIVYEGDDRFNGEYSAPPEEEDTEENETVKEEPAPKPEPEEVKPEEQTQPAEAVTENPIPEVQPNEAESLREEEPAPESEPEEVKPEGPAEPVENAETSENSAPVEETEPAAEE